ncbi:MAG: hypothetical protein HYZ44_14615 [Bacteroidetes bacterium]|nr:hypothetical protein [Bacteroidota bacterium]
MAGGTHAFDMIKRLKENDNLKKLKYFKKTEAARAGKSSNPIIIDADSWVHERTTKEKFDFGRLVTIIFKVLLLTGLVALIGYLILRLLD